MAPAVDPPPIITYDEAVVIARLARHVDAKAGKALLLKQSSKPNLMESMRTLSLVMTESRTFTGAALVDWLVANPQITKDVAAREDKTKVKPGVEGDVARATEIGKALLFHRLAHHVTDDYDFENSPRVSYSFIEDESYEIKATHKVLSAIIALPTVFHQGRLEMRTQTLFGSEAWRPAYVVLDDASSKPRMLHMYKRQSAAGAPFAEYAVEDCMCHLLECMDCKTGWYCFTLRARKGMSSSEQSVTLCADHSKKQEGWLSALMEAGVRFEKEDAGDVSHIKSIFDLEARQLRTKEIVPLSKFRGKVCLVVNVASK